MFCGLKPLLGRIEQLSQQTFSTRSNPNFHFKISVQDNIAVKFLLFVCLFFNSAVQYSYGTNYFIDFGFQSNTEIMDNFSYITAVQKRTHDSKNKKIASSFSFEVFFRIFRLGEYVNGGGRGEGGEGRRLEKKF